MLHKARTQHATHSSSRVTSTHSIIAVITTYITACRQAVNNGCIVYGGGALRGCSKNYSYNPIYTVCN